jgi:hypothetical protein
MDESFRIGSHAADMACIAIQAILTDVVEAPTRLLPVIPCQRRSPGVVPRRRWRGDKAIVMPRQISGFFNGETESGTRNCDDNLPLCERKRAARKPFAD